MRTLGWLRRSRNDLACRSGRAGAWRYAARGADSSATAAIDDAIDPALDVVRDVEGSIRSDGQTARTMRRAFGGLHGSRESVRENLAIASGLLAVHRLEDDVVAALRIRRTVPGAVEGDEESVAIARRELLTVIVEQCVRRPVRGECCGRWGLL